MSYPGQSNGVSITEYIEKCTDEHLQHPDYSAFMNICDLINDCKMDVKETVKAIKKRVKHKKSVVQLLGLGLLEMLVKNCYSACIIIGSREFQNSMTKIATNKKTAPEVRMKLLDMIQSFARSFNQTERFPHFETTYVNIVKVLGADAFPSAEVASPAFTPPSTRGTVQPISNQSKHASISSPQSKHSSYSSSSLSSQSSSHSSVSPPPSNKRYSVGLGQAKDIHDVTQQNLNFLSEIMGTIDVEKEDIRQSEVVKDLLNIVKQNAEQVQNLINSGSLLSDEVMLSKFLLLNDQIQQILNNYDEAVATFLEGPKPSPSKTPVYPYPVTPSTSQPVKPTQPSYAPPNPSAPPILDLDFLASNPSTSPQKQPPTNPIVDPFSTFSFPPQTMTYPQLQPHQSQQHNQPQQTFSTSPTPTLAPPVETSNQRGRRGSSLGHSSKPNPGSLPDLSQTFSTLNVANNGSSSNPQDDPFAEIASRHAIVTPSQPQPQLHPTVLNGQPFNPFQNSQYTQPNPYTMPSQGYQPQYGQGGPQYPTTTPQYYVPQQQQHPKANPNPFM